MAKVTLTYEFDYYEERNELNSVAYHLEILHSLSVVHDAIRSRMKWQEISEDEYKFLEQITGPLYDALKFQE